jgi:hypothetical protein
MRTVKDFKAAGLVLLGNDVVDGINGNPKSLGVTINDATKFMEKGADDVWTIRQFAWRVNNGEKPTFNGSIEWAGNQGVKHKTSMTNLVWDGRLIQWRPLINQPVIATTETPEEKEALDKIFGADSAPIEAIAPLKFFNAMADGYVDIMKVECKRDITGKWEVEEVKPRMQTLAQAHKYCGGKVPHRHNSVLIGNLKSNIIFNAENLFYLTFPQNQSIPSGYEYFCTVQEFLDFVPPARELAIADLVKVLEEAAKHGEDYAIDAAAIYDAGYRKQ